ncbi:S26 family signal peptidase [Planomonospora parontospora]|uniref:S26 family signal peptidase n=1 Tax=Planomonospora parontospora TaxID=58119 RepID=UPI0019428A5C|nr:S26 family signal peptidase [Planomonospora parontospora]GGL37686.1 S26 family signal peptidase [Planomonospora parontospora subsp. antibiotica]GII17557.1 S26 family signal peptidase [Planomonospora parontospora subsp. antibiotica]
MSGLPWPVLVPLLAVTAAAAAVLVWVRRNLLAVRVRGGSMRPSYREGDRVLVRRVTAGRLRAGDVVVADAFAFSGVLFGAPSGRHAAPAPGADAVRGQASGPGTRTDWMIKRVAAVPGDPRPVSVPARAGETAVPDGCLVLLGDNADRSLDSRHFGYAPAEGVVGRVVRLLRASEPRR